MTELGTIKQDLNLVKRNLELTKEFYKQNDKKNGDVLLDNALTLLSSIIGGIAELHE